MGGINTLSGLNNVNVDFRPAITTNVQNTGNANPPRPDVNAVPGGAPQPQRAEAKSVVRELDVLLLHAAGKSVAASAAKEVQAVGKSLVDKGVLTQKEASKLQTLADDAKTKLRALDKFSGRELAKALMQDQKTGETVWSKGLFGMSAAAKAVTAAIEAQQTLSAALEKFNGRLAKSDQVDAALQEQFTELQFQCDRRASEIDSVVFRMYDLAQKDAVNGADADPQIQALLDATFQELMPREAILMHGTAEAFEKMNANLTAQMRPLAEKLDAFAADGSKVLNREEILALQRDMATMKNALANVRGNGIEVNGGRIEVDKSLLAGMEKVLDDASQRIAHARSTSVSRTREAFLREVEASLSLDAALGGKPLPGNGGSHPVTTELTLLKNEFVRTLRQFATGKAPMDRYDAAIDKCIAKFNQPGIANLENILANLGVDPAAAKGIAKAAGGLNVVKAQFKEMMETTSKLLSDDGEFGIAADDVRRIMLGEKGISNVVGAKALGFKAGDVDSATEESNITGSRPLGAGAGGKTFLLTTKSGGELVFKPELDGRIGMDDLLLGQGGAYTDKQKTANLNLATQDTAKTFGCEDVVVKYSVGSHDGQFGVFMEKAKGVAAADFMKKSASGGGGVPPAGLHQIADPAERTKIKGDVARQLNKLMWLDLITGQGDRHWGNYFVHVDKDTHEATVKGIDNDASFTATRTGLMKFELDKGKVALFRAQLEEVCRNIHGRGWKTEQNNRVLQDPAIVRNGDTMTIDLTKAKSPEVGMALIHTLGLQSIALPEEIDRDVYDRLMEMDGDPAKKQAWLDTIAPRVSPEALRAAAARLDEAIAHAKKLATKGKVYGKEQWRNEANLQAMTGLKATVTIKKTDGSTIKPDNNIDVVKKYNERRCPSFFRREFFQNMFNPPEGA